MRTVALLISAFISFAFAKIIVITVGGNTTDNAGAVFDPQTILAEQGDIVFFNFTKGNHTATQSTFPSPCIPAHLSDSTINGFDSGFRDTVNGTAITNLRVVIDNNSTLWFFDWNTCAQGGVGGINVNQSSLETLDGFTRNALRLNGSDATAPTTSSGQASQTATSPSTSTNTTSAASRAVAYGMIITIPALVMLAALSF